MQYLSCDIVINRSTVNVLISARPGRFSSRFKRELGVVIRRGRALF